jgi:hypothetical protein
LWRVFDKEDEIQLKLEVEDPNSDSGFEEIQWEYLKPEGLKAQKNHIEFRL